MDYLCGAQISYLSQAQWRGHEDLAAELQDKYASVGRKAFFIPIGASDEIGLWGYIKASEELKQNENEQNSVFETTNDVMSFLDFSETNPFGDVQ